MRHIKTNCLTQKTTFALFITLTGFMALVPVLAQTSRKANCSLMPERYAVGFESPTRPEDVDGDGSVDEWYNSNPFGNIVSCSSLGLPCEVSSYWHHTGDDLLIHSPAETENRPIYAVDNGVVVYSTNGDDAPSSPTLGGLVMIKHIAPPEVSFYVPTYDEDFMVSGSSFNVRSHLGFSREVVSYYLHLGDVLVKKGDQIERGDTIGRTYDYSDYSNGTYFYVPHLHFEIWRKCDDHDRSGYDTRNTQFAKYANELLIDAGPFIEGNAEVLRARSIGLKMSGEIQILGEGLGSEVRPVTVVGLGKEKVTAPQSPVINSNDWTDHSIRLNVLDEYLIEEWAYFNDFVRNVSLVIGVAGLGERVVGYPFRDVEYHRWYAEHTQYLWKRGVVEGFGGTGFFLPGELIKRSELLKVAVVADCPLVEYGGSCSTGNEVPPYSDVSSDDWFYRYVKEAWNSGWLEDESLFRPEDFVVRSEVAKIIAIALNVGLMSTTDPFSDVSASSWYGPYVAGLKATGVIEGYSDGSFRPSNRMNRAESMSLIKRAFYE